MTTEPQHSETMSGAPSSSEAAGIDGDAALILAALSRIETVVRDERAALAGLRAGLVEMAHAIARAKAVADSETAAAVLDEFEHRIDAMIEIAGAAATAATEPPARTLESDQVPTVSGVVLQLGPGDAALAPATEESPPPADAAADKGPTVAMLTAMVEALNASMPGPEPAAEPPPVLEIAPQPTTTEPQPVLESPPEPEPEPPLAQAAAEPEAEQPPVLQAAPTPWAEPVVPPAAPAVHETALLASLEQMGVRPFPPPDEGTAVIFTPKPAPEPAPELPAPADPAVAFEAEQAPPPEPEQTLALAETVPPEPEPAAAPELAAASAEADFDPTDFLFGPEPEPDPAAFLLDPAPLRTAKAFPLPQPEFVATPPASELPKRPQDVKPEELKPEKLELEELEPPADADTRAEPAPHDPLHALKAMSPNEKLALFS